MINILGLCEGSPALTLILVVSTLALTSSVAPWAVKTTLAASLIVSLGILGIAVVGDNDDLFLFLGSFTSRPP